MNDVGLQIFNFNMMWLRFEFKCKKNQVAKLCFLLWF